MPCVDTGSVPQTCRGWAAEGPRAGWPSSGAGYRAEFDPSSARKTPFHLWEIAYLGASVGTARRGLLRGPTDGFLSSQPPRACFAQAQFDFSAQDPSQLSFRRGDIIEVLERLDPCWWRGRLCGRIGFFPRSYVQPVHL